MVAVKSTVCAGGRQKKKVLEIVGGTAPISGFIQLKNGDLSLPGTIVYHSVPKYKDNLNEILI